MKFSNFVLVFMGIAMCLGLIIFINTDITRKVNTENVEYANKLTSACFDASETMNTENIERYGCVWNDERDLLDTLEVFYNSLIYSFNWDNAGRVEEMALYTPVVCMVDINGYYISHNVVFNTTGMVSIPSDAQKRNGLTAINTWTNCYNGVILRYFLNDNVEVFCTDGSRFEGNRTDVYNLLLEKRPGSVEVTELVFLTDDNEFNRRKNELIVREINKQCEYYINRHNVIGDNYEMQYTFEMPEIKGEDWSRLLNAPTVITFLQGYCTNADNRMLNIYALGGGELTTNYHYFIDGDEYHCIEAETGVTKTVTPVVTTYESEGITKTVTTTYVTYAYNGSEIDAIYNTQTECAKRGKLPHRCVYDWR